MKEGSLWRTFKATCKPMKWPTLALLLMLSMSPPLSTLDGRQWPRLSETSGFWSDRSSENVRKPSPECGSPPRWKKRLMLSAWLDRSSTTLKRLVWKGHTGES
eukprot:343774-Amphidinium_carterae.1